MREKAHRWTDGWGAEEPTVYLKDIKVSASFRDVGKPNNINNFDHFYLYHTMCLSHSKTMFHDEKKPFTV